MESPLADLLACRGGGSDVTAGENSIRSAFWPTSPRAHRGSFHTIEFIISSLEDGRSYLHRIRRACGNRPACSRPLYDRLRPGWPVRGDEWDLGPVFEGGVLLIDDVERDPHMPDKPIAGRGC